MFIDKLAQTYKLVNEHQEKCSQVVCTCFKIQRKVLKIPDFSAIMLVVANVKQENNHAF